MTSCLHKHYSGLWDASITLAQCKVVRATAGLKLDRHTRRRGKFLENGIKRSFYFKANFKKTTYSRSSWKIYIIKNYAWISKVFCTKINLSFSSVLP